MRYPKTIVKATGCVAELPKSYPDDPTQFRLENPEWYERAYSQEVSVQSRYT